MNIRKIILILVCGLTLGLQACATMEPSAFMASEPCEMYSDCHESGE